MVSSKASISWLHSVEAILSVSPERPFNYHRRLWLLLSLVISSQTRSKLRKIEKWISGWKKKTFCWPGEGCRKSVAYFFLKMMSHQHGQVSFKMAASKASFETPSFRIAGTLEAETSVSGKTLLSVETKKKLFGVTSSFKSFANVWILYQCPLFPCIKGLQA